jgi:hypothetical protein
MSMPTTVVCGPATVVLGARNPFGSARGHGPWSGSNCVRDEAVAASVANSTEASSV